MSLTHFTSFVIKGGNEQQPIQVSVAGRPVHLLHCRKKDRQAERQTDGQTERQKERPIQNNFSLDST